VSRVAWLALAAGCLVSCARGGQGRGRIEVTWRGADTGKLEVPATAGWCAADSVLEIIGRSGDSGIAVALFPQDSVRPGAFPINPRGPGVARPHAGVALRWYGKTLVLGFYGLSGVVTVNQGSTLEGRVDATLKSAVDGSQLKLSGAFHDLAVTGEAKGCDRATTGVLPSSGIR